MKIVMEFQMSHEGDDDDSHEYKMAKNGEGYYNTLAELDTYLRSQLKHGNLTDEAHDALDAVRELLWEYYPGTPGE